MPNPQISKIHIYWFSGTGNSLILARHFANYWRTQQVDVFLHALPQCSIPKTSEIDICDGFAFIFPVYSSTVPTAVQNWIKKLPQLNKQPIWVISNAGKTSGCVSALIYSLLIKKGGTPFALLETLMPTNYFYTPQATKVSLIVDFAKQEIDSWCECFSKNYMSWKKPNLMAFILAKIASWGLIGFTRFIGRFFYVSKDCNQCGMCQQLCPVQNISCSETGKIQFGWHCEQCMRCYNFCSRRAIKNYFSFICHPRYSAPNIHVKDFIDEEDCNN